MTARTACLRCAATRDIEVVSGGCQGADRFGEEVAAKLGIPVKIFPADWHKYGKAAGPLRNEAMAQYADVLIVFPGGRGTQNMIECAMKHNLPVIEYDPFPQVG